MKNLLVLYLVFVFMFFSKVKTIGCQEETKLTSPSEVISMSLVTFNETKTCLWTISPPNAKRIIMTVFLFSAEKTDTLSVYDNNFNILETFVGVVENLPVVVLSGDVIYLEWQQNDVLQLSNRTWQVEYISVNSESYSWKCPVGFFLASDQKSCTPLPCVTTQWSSWEPCQDCPGDNYIQRTRQLDPSKSNDSPLCMITPAPIYEYLQMLEIPNNELDPDVVIFTLKDEFLQNSWLANQFKYSLNDSSFNVTKIEVTENDYLNILVNDVISSNRYINNSTICSPETIILLSSVAIPFLKVTTLQILPNLDLTRLTVETIQDPCGVYIAVDVMSSLSDTNLLPIGLTTGICTGLLVIVIRIIFILRKRKFNDLSSLPVQIRSYFEDAQDHSSTWIKKGVDNNTYYIKNLERDSEKYKFVHQLFNNYLHGKEIEIQNIEAVYNPNLVNAFICSRNNMEARIHSNPKLFLSQNWEMHDEDGKRSWVHEKYCQYVSKFEWNKPDMLVPIIPVVHGTDLLIALKICETGFIALSTLDSGWYGKGIYFSSSSKYILPYYATRKWPAIIISYAIPGNPFPVTEHPQKKHNLIGSAIKGGPHPSHYVIVTKNGLPPSDREETQLYDELVLNHESMVIPAFIVVPVRESVDNLAELYNRPIVLPN